ncbi:alternate signal-mediated exported protein [Psychromicrobium silvestre]|uniref:Alternate signal-mediated exported protein n=1 Tax=Psychromicrobium silvestre TaxID=1645614 RepID=A0A7Y9S9T5_9MICC|nr:SipW-dependent-type signal peptide-containing protein [Psychromicrobium silvestre]NYE96577.1 alternate signal-mediated exported protein [Psychromicrobium silvestre]
MRRRFIFASLAVVLAFVLLGGAGTAALWRSQTSINPGTVTTGNLVLLNGDSGSQLKNYLFAALSGTAMSPGQSAQAPLTIRNAGTTKFTYGLVGITGNPGDAASVAFQSALTVSIVAVGTAAQCPVNGTAATGTSLYSGPVSSSAQFSAVQTLLPATTGLLCLRVTFNASAPQTSAAGQLALTFNWRADQLR